MTILTIDETVIAALNKASGPAELRDVQGALIGFYTPSGQSRAFHTGPFTEADLPEIERRLADPKPGRTTRQVFERLQSLTSDPAEKVYLQEKIDRLVEREKCNSL